MDFNFDPKKTRYIKRVSNKEVEKVAKEVAEQIRKRERNPKIEIMMKTSNQGKLV